MSKIEIYTKDSCVFCDNAKTFFKSKNLQYIEYNIHDDPSFFEIMLKKSDGQKTMPQIFIDDKHIGGNNELQLLEKEGKLNSLLGF